MALASGGFTRGPNACVQRRRSTEGAQGTNPGHKNGEAMARVGVRCNAQLGWGAKETTWRTRPPDRGLMNSSAAWPLFLMPSNSLKRGVEKPPCEGCKEKGYLCNRVHESSADSLRWR